MLFSAFDTSAITSIAAALAVFLSLIGGVLGRLCAAFPSTPQFDRLAQRITSGLMIISALLANWVVVQVITQGHSITVHLADWIAVGDFSIEWALRFDVLAAVMVAMVTTVSACVHLYAIGYMAEDSEIPRFMGYLSLFTFFMLMLVTSDNLIQMFFGWEGVGLSSYLLIGFWHKRSSANNAAIKAFVVNRIGDLGFLLGIFATVAAFGSTNFDTIFATLPLVADLSLSFLGFSIHAPTLIAFLLFIGAMGKSAQLGLHVWLPDAMEGPTPVSALIHAATMVTAGVFMICRLSPLY
jgi:NADH-quinone oxidoreductase subunit L